VNDLRVTIEKKTDQLNFEDFLGGITRTITIAGVKRGTKEQQYDIAIEGDSRVWRPSVTVLKLLVQAWGDDAKEWVGRRATLYGDPTVTFGGDVVGGIRVSHLSHIDKAVVANLTVTRGKRATHTVQPLVEAASPAEPTAEEVAAETKPDVLRSWWKPSRAERRAQIEARVAELTGGQS
jgi:hypothetical protein